MSFFFSNNVDHGRTNGNKVGIYTSHIVMFKDAGDAQIYRDVYNKLLGDRVSLLTIGGWWGISKKPKENTYIESALELINRWGMHFNLDVEENGVEEMNIKSEGFDVWVEYNYVGELSGYNKVKKHKTHIVLSYDPEIKEKDIYKLKGNYRYFGKRIGRVGVDDTSIQILESRVSELKANGLDYLKRLGSLKVCIIGLGGSGSNIMDQLIRKGVKNFKVFDSDVIKEKNLNRLPLQAFNMVGKNKNDMFDEIKGISVEKHGNWEDEDFSDCDVVIMCVDDGKTRTRIINKINEKPIPSIDTGIGYTNFGRVSIVYNYNIINCFPIPPVLDVEENEYGVSINLQLCEQATHIASKVAELFTRLGGLYLNPNIDDLKYYKYVEESDEKDE